MNEIIKLILEAKQQYEERTELSEQCLCAFLYDINDSKIPASIDDYIKTVTGGGFFYYKKVKPIAYFKYMKEIFTQEQIVKEEVYWEFPNFVTQAVLEEVIKNTCFKCGGLMTSGLALDNTWTSSDDFGGDKGSYGTTASKNGPAIMVKVRKCADCGNSHY